ncbi:MAG: DUF2092 domain-containing protein [Thiobacillus sp.]|nr:DUF2092 domain-containing protein [Thiobacillus sp.]
MAILNFRMAAAGFALATLMLSTIIPAQAQTVDPAAVQTLQRSLDYLASLKQFSVRTQNTVEEVLDLGQKVQLDSANILMIKRPNKLLAKRHGDIIDQSFSYDGKTLSLYNASHNYFASVPAPDNIEAMLDYARESLGIIAPASDLVYTNAFPLMMEHVWSAIIVGKAAIGGVTTDHLVFSRPDVDFQIWVPETGAPLPLKYVVTDKLHFAHPSTTVVMSDWNVDPNLTDSVFNFQPPQNATETDFLRLDASSASAQ